jgi:hypothetical protein
MTTKEFLQRYDDSGYFTEQELEVLWWDDLLETHAPTVQDEEYSEPDRWNILVNKVIQVDDRYFMIYKYQGNTEYQENYYGIQPDEVYPVEKTITVWEASK